MKQIYMYYVAVISYEQAILLSTCMFFRINPLQGQIQGGQLGGA